MTAWGVRARLTLAYLAALLVIVAVYAAAIFLVVRGTASRGLDDRLLSDFQWAVEMWQRQPDGTLTWFEGEPGDPGTPWLRVWHRDGRLLHQTTNADWYPIAASAQLAARADGRITPVPVGDTVYRVLSAPASVNGSDVVIQVARSEAALRQDQRQLAVVLAVGLPLVLVLAGGIGYGLARRALAPVDRMTARARSITAQHLHDRLPVEHPHDELGRLAAVINEMLAGLQSSFDRMQRFTADVSHQLRTPLMAMRTVGEVALRGRPDAGAYREVIGSMLEDADRLSLLVDQLLALARAENGGRTPRLAAVDLGGLARVVTGELSVLAEEQQQRLTVELPGPALGLADPVLLRQAVTNLVDNAIQHGGRGARVHVVVWAAGDYCGLDIRDDGPGIPPRHRAHLLDGTARDPSSLDTGTGEGLGLGIARRAIAAMGGELTLEPSQRGSLFRITLTAAGANA